MKKTSLTPIWDMMRLRHGIALRCIQAVPAEQLDSHPVRDMRTPKELVVHMYGFMRAAAESVEAGTLSLDYETDAPKVKTRDELVGYANDSWKRADAAVAKLTDAQLASAVKAPWGEMPGHLMISFIPEEFLHHRGQLYAYLRQLGVAPPPNWDFENSAPEFQPKQPA